MRPAVLRLTLPPSSSGNRPTRHKPTCHRRTRHRPTSHTGLLVLGHFVIGTLVKGSRSSAEHSSLDDRVLTGTRSALLSNKRSDLHAFMHFCKKQKKNNEGQMRFRILHDCGTQVLLFSGFVIRLGCNALYKRPDPF